jgi:hypothetical protein
MPNRNLTDEDADIIANRIWEKAKEEFFLNAGKGFLGLVWKGVLLGMLILAAYGAGKHGVG